MPTVSLTLEDTNRSILNNAYFKIINDIVDTVKIPANTVVAVHKDIDYTLTDNKTNVTGVEAKNLPSTASLRRIQASITEEYNEDALTTTAVHQVSAFPIFEDRDISVTVFPIYVKSDVTIEFSYFTPSKTEANRIRDDIRIRLSQTRNIGMHEIEYDIMLPEVVEEFVADIHVLKNRLVPQPLQQYFAEHSTKRMHLITDLSNSENARIAIYEKQVRIVGLFDFSSMPEKVEADNENGNYKVSFSYKLSFDVPRAIGLRYPVMICNKVLPSKYVKFIEDGKVYSLEERKKNLGYTQSLHALSHFEAHRQLENRVDINFPINIPAFDDFDVRQGHKCYVIVASFLTDVNETDKRTLLNLRDIEPFYIPEKILNFISLGEHAFVKSPYSSFLYFGIHQDDAYFDAMSVVTPDLTIKATNDLSLMKPVRVTLSLIIDLTMLNKDAINRLLTNEDMLLIFVAEWLNVYDNFKTEFSRTFGSMDDIYKIFIYIIDYLRNRSLNDLLGKILTLLQTNPYLYDGLINILYDKFPDLYN
ncbi:MAG: hypothetical protein HGA35_00400, partial [Erysipelotrichaceae bacterium]|nr:hypothetical protein [Erysipelotrichaceae bacterium]